MLGQIAKIALTATVLGSLPFLAKAAEPSAHKPPAGGIVVLRNGEIIEGRITHADGVYVIDLSDGQIRLKDADVDLVCGSLEEGYRRKRALIQVGNVHDHLELAQWCLRHNLLGSAAVELADARVADPNNPMIAALQQRLKMAVEPPPHDAKNTLPPGPTNDELDRMVRGLPRGAVEAFTQSVQPVLMNHCTGSGCHGLQSTTGMRLIRIAAGKSPSRRFTQRNLYSVLHYVDQENPLQSKLLTAAGGPHGTVQTAIFSEHEAAQYKLLVEWVGLISGREMPAAPAAAAESALTEPPPAMLPKESRKAHRLPPADRGPKVALHKRNVPPTAADQPAAEPSDPQTSKGRPTPEKPAAKN